jgi:hypothetical protein
MSASRRAGGSGEVTALQRALAAEHAASYAYGLAGPFLLGEVQREARAAHAGHLARRDRLAAHLADAGQVPTAPAPIYDLPGPVTNPATAQALVLVVEERLAAVWADAVAAPEPGLREMSALALQETAVRAARWRGASVAFPGLPERSGS